MRTLLMGLTAIFAAAAPALSSADQGIAVARMPHGMALMVMDSAMSCNGGPTAMVNDKNGRKIDQTCNVHFTPDGVRVLFAGYGKPLFFSKDQFSMVQSP